ncbi:hypothetical protein [Catenulispora sp. GAS73]|uniref:hypothetical protein n=1 Tax=Catenulispora sp. GAS73 TaxID=3156269 RepID=UPI0035120CF2
MNRSTPPTWPLAAPVCPSEIATSFGVQAVARAADVGDEAPDGEALKDVADVELVGADVDVCADTPPPAPDEPAAGPPAADRLAHPPTVATSTAPTAKRIRVLIFKA